MDEIDVRKGVAEDCAAIYQMFKELLELEKIRPDRPIDEQSLFRDGFGPRPIFETLVAESKDRNGQSCLMGFVLYFFHYSVFSGRSVFLEALYVKPEHQKKGLGKLLWKKMIQASLESDCGRCIFHAFGWNDSAVRFYEKCGAVNFTEEKEENVFHVTKENMIKFCSS